MDFMDVMLSGLIGVIRELQYKGQDMNLDEVEKILGYVPNKAKKGLGEWN
ncbi:hypothetical protein KI387_001122, partial [Taxus chinensis]